MRERRRYRCVPEGRSKEDARGERIPAKTGGLGSARATLTQFWRGFTQLRKSTREGGRPFYKPPAAAVIADRIRRRDPVLSQNGRHRRRRAARVTILRANRSVSFPRESADSAEINVNFETNRLEIVVAGVKVSSMPIGELIRRERLLQAPAAGECRATLDNVDGDHVRITLEVSADFTLAEAMSLSVDGTFPELAAKRIAGPVRDAIVGLMKPRGLITLT